MTTNQKLRSTYKANQLPAIVDATSRRESDRRRTVEIPAAEIQAMLARVYPELQQSRETVRANYAERLQDMIDAGRIRSASLTDTVELPAFDETAPKSKRCNFYPEMKDTTVLPAIEYDEE